MKISESLNCSQGETDTFESALAEARLVLSSHLLNPITSLDQLETFSVVRQKDGLFHYHVHFDLADTQPAPAAPGREE